MNTYIVVCSGYTAENEADLMVIALHEDGSFEVKDSCRQGENPSFCIRHGQFLYAVEEVDNAAAIRAWKINGDKLETTDMRIEVPGSALCHLCVTENALIGSSYLTGDYFAVDFALTKILWHRKPIPYNNPENARQECPHAHWAAFWGEELVLADLGSDRLWRYQMEDGIPVKELIPLRLEKGAGPRQPMELDETYLVSVQELDSTLCLWKKAGDTAVCVDKIRTTGKDCANFPGTMCMADENTILICNRGSNTISAVKRQGDFLEFAGEWDTAVWPRHLMRVADSNLFINSCNESGTLVIFAMENQELVKKQEFAFPGASCAAVL